MLMEIFLAVIVCAIAVIILIKTSKKAKNTYSRILAKMNILKAKIYLFLKNNKAAKDALLAIIDNDPENYDAHKMLAEIYEQEGGMRKAIDEYVQAIDINKQDYDSYYKIADLLTQLDKKDEAAEMLNNLLRKKPEYTKATQLLGEILIDKQMYKEAVSVYTEGLRYNPTSFDFNYNLGIAFTMLNDFQSAKLYYERAAELNSLAYNSKYSLAEIAMIYKELEEAEKYFLEVLEEENSELEADAYYELAKISIIKGEKQKAIHYANIAIEVDAKKIVPKIKEEEVFIPIIAKINIPFNLENLDEDEKPKQLSEKDIMAKEHLEEMVDKTRKLGYGDIDVLNREYRRTKKEAQKDFNLINRERE